MAYRSFFESGDDPYFDKAGRPKTAGIYEFRRYDGRIILYRLDWLVREEGEPPVLKVVHASRLQDYPSPTHALKNLDGTWIRYIGPLPEEDEPARNDEPRHGDATQEPPA